MTRHFYTINLLLLFKNGDYNSITLPGRYRKESDAAEDIKEIVSKIPPTDLEEYVVRSTITTENLSHWEIVVYNSLGARMNVILDLMYYNEEEASKEAEKIADMVFEETDEHWSLIPARYVKLYTNKYSWVCPECGRTNELDTIPYQVYSPGSLTCVCGMLIGVSDIVGPEHIY